LPLIRILLNNMWL